MRSAATPHGAFTSPLRTPCSLQPMARAQQEQPGGSRTTASCPGRGQVWIGRIRPAGRTRAAKLCEEQAQQGSLLGGWPEVQVRCAAWGPRLYMCAATGRGRRQNSAGQRISYTKSSWWLCGGLRYISANLSKLSGTF